jgi:hypothetical protein
MEAEPAGLVGPRLKWEGPYATSKAKGKVAEFAESDPHRVTVEFEPMPAAMSRAWNQGGARPPIGSHGWRVRPQPPVLLGPLAWLLARLTNPAKVCNKNRVSIYFPVCHAPEAFLKHSAPPLLPEDARAFMRRFQPYERFSEPHDHWLAGFNMLWNSDKQRLVHAVMTLAHIWGDHFPGVIYRSIFRYGYLTKRLPTPEAFLVMLSSSPSGPFWDSTAPRLILSWARKANALIMNFPPRTRGGHTGTDAAVTLIALAGKAPASSA